MVSQRQIAKMLDMTQQAVSAALRPLGENETSRVAPETRQLVLETAERLGYRVNRYASILKSGKSGIIALLTGNLPYYRAAEKIKRVAEELATHGYLPWHYNVSAYPQRKKQTLNVLMDAKVEGAIVSWGVDPEILEALRRAKIPMISYEGHRYPDIPWIWPDKVAGYHQLVLHLIDQGCENILIGRHQTQRAYENREGSDLMIEALAGYLSGMQAAGRTPNPSPIVFAPEGSPDYEALDSFRDHQCGYLIMNEALKQKPDAVMFPNDSFAVGALCACRDAGVRVPEEVCITGLNNDPQSLYSWIPITTLREPIERMVFDATSLLIKRIQQPDTLQESPPKYKCDILIRQSSCPRSEPVKERLLPPESAYSIPPPSSHLPGKPKTKAIDSATS